jgi:hypothetical protein
MKAREVAIIQARLIKGESVDSKMVGEAIGAAISAWLESEAKAKTLEQENEELRITRTQTIKDELDRGRMEWILDQVMEMCGGATVGPWQVTGPDCNDRYHLRQGTGPENSAGPILNEVCNYWGVDQDRANAELMAKSRTIMPELVGALRWALGLKDAEYCGGGKIAEEVECRLEAVADELDRCPPSSTS